MSCCPRRSSAYPWPIYMEGKVFPVGVHEPEYVSYRMRELYHHAVSAAVRDMLGVGLDIVTDGGQYYENELATSTPSCSTRWPTSSTATPGTATRIQVGAFDLPIYKPTVLGDVAWRRPVFKPVVEAVREETTYYEGWNASLGPATLSASSTTSTTMTSRRCPRTSQRRKRGVQGTRAARRGLYQTPSRSPSSSPRTGLSRRSTPRSRVSMPTRSCISAMATKRGSPAFSI